MLLHGATHRDQPVKLLFLRIMLYYSVLKFTYYAHYYAQERTINIYFILPYYAGIMLALCLMLSMTHYAQNYAGIIGGSLAMHVLFYLCIHYISS